MDNFYEILDKKVWSMWGLWKNTKYKKIYDVILELKGDKDVYIYDEITKTKICVHKGDLIRGVIDSKIGCMTVLFHIDKYIPHEIRESYLGYEVTCVRSRHVKIMHGYVPDKERCLKLYLIQKNTEELKKILKDELEYHPKYGVKYLEYVSDPEFIKRWGINKL